MTWFAQNYRWEPTTEGAIVAKGKTSDFTVTPCLGDDELARHIAEAHNLWLSMNQPSQVTLTHNAAFAGAIQYDATEQEARAKLQVESMKLENVRLEQEIRSLQIENETAALHLKQEELTYKQREDRQKTPLGSLSSTSTPTLESSTGVMMSLFRQMTLFQCWMQVATLRVLRSTTSSKDFEQAKKELTDLGSYVDDQQTRKL